MPTKASTTTKILALCALYLTIACIMACGGQGNPESCVSDNDCKGERICQNGVCTTPTKTDTCTKDSDCKGERICKEGTCTESKTQTRGFTTCGDITCQPGQYCRPTFSTCRNGCLSDLNCLDNQTCVDVKGESEKQCQNKEPTPSGQLAYCKAGCDKLQSCGLFGVADTTACYNDCEKLDDNARKAFGDCAGEWRCITIPACLNGVQCGGSFKCPGSQTCVDFQCL